MSMDALRPWRDLPFTVRLRARKRNVNPTKPARSICGWILRLEGDMALRSGGADDACQNTPGSAATSYEARRRCGSPAASLALLYCGPWLLPFRLDCLGPLCPAARPVVNVCHPRKA